MLCNIIYFKEMAWMRMYSTYFKVATQKRHFSWTIIFRICSYAYESWNCYLFILHMLHHLYTRTVALTMIKYSHLIITLASTGKRKLFVVVTKLKEKYNINQASIVYALIFALFVLKFFRRQSEEYNRKEWFYGK